MVEFLLDAENQADKTANGKKSKYFAGIAFDPNMDGTSTMLKYSIRMDAKPRVEEYEKDDQESGDKSQAWRTKFSFPVFIRQGPRAMKNPFGGQPFYQMNAFLLLQHAVDRSLMLQFNNTLTDDDIPEVALRRFPFPQYLENKFIPAVQFGLPLLLFLAYIYTALTLVRSIVLEKERRLKVRFNY